MLVASTILGEEPYILCYDIIWTYARSRKHNVPIDFDTYRDWHARQGSNLQPGPTISSALQVVSPQDATGISVLTGNSDGSNTISSEHPAFYPLNFNHIVELITTGQQIPGIKEIPNTILTGQASEATLSKRRKPWEIPRSADRATEESFWKADLGPRLSDANKDMETG